MGPGDAATASRLAWARVRRSVAPASGSPPAATVPASLGEERRCNVFLRVGEAAVRM